MGSHIWDVPTGLSLLMVPGDGCTFLTTQPWATLGKARTADGLIPYRKEKAALILCSFLKTSDLLFFKSFNELTQESHQSQVPREEVKKQKSHQRKIFRKSLEKSPRFAILKKINLFLILFNLILLERAKDLDLLSDPGGKATQLIFNSPHCCPHTCAAYLGWQATLGRAPSDTLTIL